MTGAGPSCRLTSSAEVLYFAASTEDVRSTGQGSRVSEREPEMSLQERRTGPPCEKQTGGISDDYDYSGCAGDDRRGNREYQSDRRSGQKVMYRTLSRTNTEDQGSSET